LAVIGECEKSQDELSLEKNCMVILEPETVIMASTLAEVSFCPQAYLAKEKMPPTEMNYHILLGILVHHAFGALLSSNKPSDIKRLARQAIKKHRETITKTPLAPSEEGIMLDILSNLERIEPWLAEMKESHQGWEVRVEESLQSENLGQKGRIDGLLLHQNDNSAAILELKTGRAGGLYAPLEHQIQLTCYAMLVEEQILNEGSNIKCFALYSNEPDYFIEREVSPNYRRRLQAIDSRNLIIGIKKGWHRPARENQPQCPTCRFAEGCSKLK